MGSSSACQQNHSKGVYKSVFEIPENLLNGGEYFLHVALDNSSPRVCYDAHLNAISFSVWDPMNEESIARGKYSNIWEDVMLLPALKCRYELLQ